MSLSREGNSRPNVSFSFSKQSSVKLKSHQLQNMNHKKTFCVESQKVTSTKSKGKKKELIIPMINKNNWRHLVSHDICGDKPRNNSELSELAVKELLEESALEKEKQVFENSALTIPMVIQNKIPEGYETDMKLDTMLRAEESTIEDYDQIPIDKFGIAMLKGMGCNPGDPVGNKNKRFVKPLPVVPRSRGLGLGADKRFSQSPHDNKLKTGAFVHILEGSKKGSFGLVEGMNDSRVIIKLENMKKTVSLPFLYVEVISKQRIEKRSEVLNQNAYEMYKNEFESRAEYCSHRSVKSCHSDMSCNCNDNLSMSSKDEKFLDKINTVNEISGHLSNGNNKEPKHSIKSEKEHNEELTHENWVFPDLRVRFIDGNYKNGRYFNQKMIVEDVVSSECCICRTEGGKCLEGLSPRTLETVIPRYPNSCVMVVQGKYKKQLATILERDKTNCIATVQFLSNKQKVKKFSYDSICEYVGDISQFE